MDDFIEELVPILVLGQGEALLHSRFELAWKIIFVLQEQFGN